MLHCLSCSLLMNIGQMLCFAPTQPFAARLWSVSQDAPVRGVSRAQKAKADVHWAVGMPECHWTMFGITASAMTILTSVLLRLSGASRCLEMALLKQALHLAVVMSVRRTGAVSNQAFASM